MNNNINNDQTKKESISKIETINAIEGFDPMSFAIDFGDMNEGTKRKHLPVMIQMAWFRLKYPEGRIAIDVKAERDYFIAKARVYTHFANPDNQYLAEGSASRGYTKENPTVSPREWAQTAAVGIALRNAGFGLQADIAGESYEGNTLNEFPFILAQETPDNMTGAIIPANSTATAITRQNFSQTEIKSEAQTGEITQIHMDSEPTPLEKAMAAICPISKHKDKTLGDLIRIDPGALAYIARNSEKYGNEIAGYAKLICEHALNQAAG